MEISAQDKAFLFLQGPHGPFFDRLGKMVAQSGAKTWRVGFNRGDAAFWSDKSTYIPFLDTLETWPEAFRIMVEEKSITDLVLYGDTRACHSTAIAEAKDLGLKVHVFEEGYLRPYWVTYERDGVNGHSRLMTMTIAEMRAALQSLDLDLPDAPAQWGDMREHIYYGAVYHFLLLAMNRRYRNYHPHRALSVSQEFRLYIKRLLTLPYTAIQRKFATRRIKRGGFPYHLCLLQLEHDASFQKHSPFSTMTEFLDITLKGFSEGAPGHHHLVFKAHPLEDGRVNLHRSINELALKHGVADRVHFVRGGKLAALLNTARSAVTVNSTAAQQALWRGLPLKVFGEAVYDKPEFVSTQAVPAFFANPDRPDSRAYRAYRHYLLETSQIPGGFYSARGRQRLLRQVVDMMLTHEDPYDALTQGTATPRQQLTRVR